jgi:hypothetical protein
LQKDLPWTQAIHFLPERQKKMFDLSLLQTELHRFFSRKTKLALLILASYLSLC